MVEKLCFVAYKVGSSHLTSVACEEFSRLCNTRVLNIFLSIVQFGVTEIIPTVVIVHYVRYHCHPYISGKLILPEKQHI